MNDSHPLVSVIVPSYNHRPFVGKAIDSVLSQSLWDLELIIIDDASTDGSQEVIRGYDDPRIRSWFHQTNSGSAATINHGIRAAKGKYVCILNSDDYFAPERLELLFQDCEKNGVLFAATDIELVNEQDECVLDKNHWWIDWFESLKNKYVATNDILQGLLCGNFFITTSNFFIKREVFKQVGLFYNYKFVLDYEFILRFLAYNPGSAKFWIDRKLVFYRLHGANTIQGDPVEANKETHQVLLKWFSEYLPWKERVRFQSLAYQLSKCLRHVEEETRLSWQEHRDRLLQHKEQEVQEYRVQCRETQRQLDQAQSQLQELADRYSHLDERLRGVARYLNEHRADGQEVGSDAGMRALESTLESQLPEKIDYLSEAVERLASEALHWQRRVQERDWCLEALRMSRSYRLGHALLQPGRLFKKMLMRLS
jgi:glycosyltransferase involved in cell wall biosynthesis